MSDTRTVSVRLKADVTSYTTSMKQASQSTANFDKQQARSQASAEKWRAVGLASKIGGAALAAGLLAATKAASDQEQAMGALTSVFKTNGAQMTANAKGATQMGLSTTDYANAAAKLGSQLSNLGVDQKDLGGATDDLIKKAGDLAAQFGGTTQEAVDALGAAMRGEADPAERYGLALNITAVNAEEAATGADRAGAMMSLLNKQMAKSGAVGAMGREFDTAASSVQRAQAEFDNATASLGEALLPAMATAAKAVSGLLEKFNDLPQPVKETTTLVIGLGAAALLAGPKVISAVRMMKGALSKLPDLAAIADPFSKSNVSMGKFATMATKVGAVGVAAAIAIPIITDLGQALNGITEGHAEGDLALLEQQLIAFARNGGGELGRFAGDAEGSMGSIGDAVTKSGNLMKSGFEMAGNQAQVARDQLNALDSSLASLASTSPEQAAAAFGKIQEATLAAGGSVEDLRGAFPQYVNAVDAAALSTDNAAASSNAAAEAKENEAAALKKATEAYDAYIGAVQEALGLLSAQNNMAGQVERLTKAVKENGTALDKRSAAGRANRDVMIGELGSIADVIDATQKNVTAKHGEAAGLKAANRVRLEELARLKESAAALGFNKEQVAALIRKSGLVKPIKLPVAAPGLDGTLSQVEALARAMQKVVNNSGLNLGFKPGHAAGGYITGPGSGTSDSIPANLSNGEYVLKASAVKRIGVGELNRMNYANGGVVGYAKGGKAKKPGKGKGMGQGNGGLGNVQKWTDAVKDARDNLRDIKQEAADYAKSIADNILSGTGLFDMFSKSKAEDATKGLATAQTQLAEASRKVAEAQIAVNTAAPEDRAKAIKDLADAQRDLASAQTDQASAQATADAAAPTPANIMGRMKARADAIEAYASKVKTLMGKGLSMSLIKELAGSDMVEAGPVLDALLSMSPEALKQLGAVDKRAKDAAASIGDAVSTGAGVPGGGAFGGKIGDAKAELGVSTDGLDKAIKLADKKIDKEWRKKLAKMGLSAEERVQLMQSLKQNDGKLTREWRNKLAKAGLSAEERADLVTAITGADTTMGREWRDKTHKTGLSAEEKADLKAEIIDAGENPSRNMQKEWRKKLMATGLTAQEANDMIANIQTTHGRAKEKWDDDKSHKTPLGAHGDNLGADVENNGNKHTAVTGWQNDNKKTGLGARDKTVGADVDSQGYGNSKLGTWVGDNIKTGLGAKNKTVGTDVDSDGYGNPKLGTWVGDNIKTGLGAKNKSVGEDVGSEGYGNAKLGTWVGDVVKTSLGAKSGNRPDKKSLGEDVDSEGYGNAKLGAWVGDTIKTSLGAKANTASVNKAMYDVAYAAWKVMSDSGLNKFMKMPKPSKKDFGLAMGGMVRGAGTGTSDSIPAMLSNGEFVMRAAAVSKYGADMLSAINAGRFANGGPVGFRTTTNAPLGGAGGVTTTNVPVIVQLDGRTIAQSQLKLQRQSGGTITVGG